MNSKKMFAIFSIIAIIICIFGGFFLLNNNTTSLQGQINTLTKNRINYMESKGITVLDSSECKLVPTSKGETAVGNFGAFVYLLLTDKDANKTVYLSWINLTKEIKIPKFFYLWTIKNSSYIFKTNFIPCFEIELKGLEGIQEKLDSEFELFTIELKAKGFTIQTYNDSLGQMWAEWKTFEDFITMAELSSSGTIYTYRANVTNNLQRPIFFYMNWGIKFTYSPYQ